VEIHLDGIKREVTEGATLGDLLKDRDVRCSVAVIRSVEGTAEQTPYIRLYTTKGEVVIETTDPRFTLLETPEASTNLRVQWGDRYAVAFGPFSAQFQPSRSAASYGRGDVILGCGGYDPKRAFLIFSRMRHLADHGASADGGVLGRVTSGRGVLDRWESGDSITQMERVVSWEDRTRSFTTRDSTLLLEEGMQIITYVGGNAQGYTPEHVETDAAESVEHLLLALRDHHFMVNRAMSTHIRDCRVSPLDVPPAVKRPRREGTITIRTVGPSRGCIYLYRADVPSHPTHTVVGQITHGLELTKLAQEGETICVKILPETMDLVGKTVDKGMILAMDRGIKAEVDTDGSNRIIVDQEPATTLEILKAKTIRLITAPSEKVVTIRLDDAQAPATTAIFREMTGLRFLEIGKLPIFFRFEDVVLFKTPMTGQIKILPENSPTTEVPAYQIGVTNEARKGTGTIGVRLSDNSEFGPTGEIFEATNIIGTVLEPEKLENLREKDILYIKEAPA
jgi:putative methanogenesis marker protein 3